MLSVNRRRGGMIVMTIDGNATTWKNIAVATRG